MGKCKSCGKEVQLHFASDVGFISSHFCSNQCEHNWFEEFVDFDEAVEALSRLLDKEKEVSSF